MEKPNLMISLASARDGHEMSDLMKRKPNKVVPSSHDTPSDSAFISLGGGPGPEPVPEIKS